VKIVLLDKLYEICHTGTIASNNEVNVREHGEDLRNDRKQKVDTFSVLKSRDEHDVNLVWVA